ncbi:hypothetical protein KUTeg_002142, partial [Tegillarca granosa]
SAPLTLIGKKQRRVPNFAFDEDKYPTLSYSPSLDGVFCNVCVAFSKNQNVLSTKPLTDWSNAKKVVDTHLGTKEHMRAVELSKNFLRVCKNDAPSIAEKISSAYKEKIERNRSALISIIKTIILCGKQNIALRGKTDDSSNFRELLKFRAETDEALNYHLQNSPPNAKYITINSFDFVICVFICHNTLKYLSPISDGLQNPECDLVRAADQAHALVTFLSSKREDVSFYDKVWHEATSLADANEITVDKPRTAARQIHRTNVHAETAKEYWRLNVFNEFVDHLKTQLQERLCDSRPRLKAQYLLSHKINLLTNDMWQDIKECYNFPRDSSDVVP